ncbi:hypothetical protein V5799_005038 [Amblyomma americanum]|uniref:Uncharacterized protein n=1 Tax=Amblyomma americanum TaxID=6943 RepID=A0AAQ4D4E0_AMBAM
MNRTMLPFSVEKATPVAVTANAAVPSATTKTPAPPSTPVVAVGDQDAETGDAEKPAAPSEKLWAALRTFGTWKATVLGSGHPGFFSTSTDSTVRADLYACRPYFCC